MPPYFSVVIPTYNRASAIGATLESVRRQTFGDFECLIVDDGSDDFEQLEQVVTELSDDRFKVIRQRNGGGGAARNTGIVNASGQYIAFLDSDDLFLPEKLQVFFDYFQENQADAAYSYAHVDRGVPGKTWIRPDRPMRPGETMASYLFISNQFVQTSTIVMATEAARRVMFDPSLRKGQDLDFCLRAHAAGIKFVMIERPLIIWTDVSEVGRTSRHAGVAGPEAWLAAHAHLMSEDEILGYRATVLAYYWPKRKFITVARDLLAGFVYAKVPAKVAIRQWLRFCLPRPIYRKLVALAIKFSRA